MNAEYIYIVKTFLPEITLLGLGLLALALDLVLPQQNKRRALTIVVAFGCLFAAGIAGVQWLQSDSAAPDFVRSHVQEMSQEAAQAFGQKAQQWHGNENVQVLLDHGLAEEVAFLLRKPLPDSREPVWGLNHVTEAQALTLLQLASANSGDITNTDARAAVVAYRAAQQDLPELPNLHIGLGHPGFACWWLFANEQFSAAMKVIFALAVFLVLLLSVQFPVERYRAEFASLLMFATIGLMIMANTLDLVVLFLGLELAAVCLYALAAWHKGDARSSEAGVKYLLLGSLASAFFIYGASLLFVKYGSTHLSVLASQTLMGEPLVYIGLMMLLVGFGFKIAGAPLHLWAPDVYQGAPTSVAAFLSTGSKAAGFAALLRMLSLGFLTMSAQWVVLIGVMAALSMLIGNLVAVHQKNVKRLLAYSGIAQAGYLLIAVMAVGLSFLHGPKATGLGPNWGVTAVVLYLFLYTVANIGAFAITGIVARDTGSEDMTAFAGLRTRAPLMAFAMTLLLLSLGGIPLLAGFVGKWFLFLSGIHEGQYLLVLLGAATSVISIYYYLLIIKQIYILPAAEEAKPIRLGPAVSFGLTAIVIITLAIGFYPRPFLDIAQTTARSLLGW